MEKKTTKITLGAKMGLISMCLAQSTNQVEQQYADDTNLNPAYHLTPEVMQELLDNELAIEEIVEGVASFVITKKGIWFAHYGLSDAPSSFESFVKPLTPTATHALFIVCQGELAKRHQTTSSETVALQIENIFDSMEESLLGIKVSKLTELPKNFQFKSIKKMSVDYDKMLAYNRNKVSKKF